MNKFNWLNSALLFALIFTSCNTAPAIDNFDQQTWKSDRNACGNKRAVMKDILLEQKQKLLGKNEMEVVEMLGKPDRNELYKRNQKFYYYFLSPGPECKQPSADAQKLAVRFNAMGLAKEVTIE